MNSKTDNHSCITWLAPVIVLAIGILPMPIGYYTLLRLIVCACAIYYAYSLSQSEDKTFMFIFGFLAILYNPILPVYLYEKSIWIILNIITAALFFLKRRNDELTKEV